MQGKPAYTISQGKVVFANGELKVERGAGRYIKRPAFPNIYEAVERYNRTHVPVPVERD